MYRNKTCSPSSPLKFISLYTLPPAPSRAPGGLIVVSIGSRTATLTWTELAEGDRNGIIRDYLIRVVPAESSHWLQPSRHVASSPELTITLSNLHPHTNYNVCVAAFTIAAGPYSNKTLILTEQERKLKDKIFVYCIGKFFGWSNIWRFH